MPRADPGAMAESLLSADITRPLVRLHYYGGLSITEAGSMLGLSWTAAYEFWYYARASLRVTLG